MTAPVEANLPAPIFDRSGRVAGPGWGEVAAEWADVLIGRYRLKRGIDLASLPRGDGHPVIVVPAFLCPDLMTRGLRQVLAKLGYAAQGWGAGSNIGPTDAAIAAIETALDAAAQRHGRRVTLIGHSLGGVLARGLACRHPERVRRVVTVCSPFRLPTASPLEPAYRWFSRWHSVESAALQAGLAVGPPVPTTAIYTRRDGIVAWESTRDPPQPQGLHADPGWRESVEVDGRHSTMLVHPQAVRIIAERLALPETGRD